MSENGQPTPSREFYAMAFVECLSCATAGLLAAWALYGNEGEVMQESQRLWLVQEAERIAILELDMVKRQFPPAPG